MVYATCTTKIFRLMANRATEGNRVQERIDRTSGGKGLGDQCENRKPPAARAVHREMQSREDTRSCDEKKEMLWDEVKEPVPMRNGSSSSVSWRSSDRRRQERERRATRRDRRDAALGRQLQAELEQHLGEQDALDEIESGTVERAQRREKLAPGRIDPDKEVVVNPWEAKELKWKWLGTDGHDFWWQVQTKHDQLPGLILNMNVREIRRGECILGLDSYTGYRGVYYPVERFGSDVGMVWGEREVLQRAVKLAVVEATRVGKWDLKLLTNASLGHLRTYGEPWPGVETEIMNMLLGEETVEYRTELLEAIHLTRPSHSDLTLLSNVLKQPEVGTTQLIFREMRDGLKALYLDENNSVKPWFRYAKSLALATGLVVMSCGIALSFKAPKSLRAVPMLGSVAVSCAVLGFANQYVNKGRILLRSVPKEHPSNITFRPLSLLNLVAKCSGPIEVDVLPGLTRPKGYETPCEGKNVEIYGCTIKGATLVTPTPCHHNQYNAFAIRMFFPRERNEFVIDDFMNFFRKTILPRLFSKGMKMYSLDDCVERIGGKRGRAIMEAEPNCRIDRDSAMIDSFVKREIYVGKHPNNFKPRMINGRRLPFLRRVMALMYSICKSIESSFSSDDMVTIDSGLSATVVGLLAEKCSCYKFLLESDVSNWDGSLGSFFRILEMEIFDAAPIHVEWIKEVKEVWQNTDVRGKNGFKARLNWGRNSGEVITSTFNSVFNLSLVMYVASKLDARARIVVKGDDNFFGITKWDSSKANEIYHDLGIKKVEFILRKSVATLEYCSGKFYRVDGEAAVWKWGLKPFRQLSKFGVNFHNHPKKVHHRLLVGTAISMMPICGHVPILGEFMNHVSRLHPKPIEVKREDWQNTDGTIHFPPSDEEIIKFCHEYDLSTAEYKQIVKGFAAIKLRDFPMIIDDPWVLRCFNKECGLDSGAYCDENLVEIPRTTVPAHRGRRLFGKEPVSEVAPGAVMEMPRDWTTGLSDTEAQARMQEAWSQRWRYLVVVLTAPFFEEICREYAPIATTAGLSAVEGTLVSPANFVGHLVLHLFPFSWRIGLHLTWNAAAGMMNLSTLRHHLMALEQGKFGTPPDRAAEKYAWLKPGSVAALLFTSEYDVKLPHGADTNANRCLGLDTLQSRRSTGLPNEEDRGSLSLSSGSRPRKPGLFSLMDDCVGFSNNRLTSNDPLGAVDLVLVPYPERDKYCTKNTTKRTKKAIQKVAKAMTVVASGQKKKKKSKNSSPKVSMNLASALTGAISAGMKLGGGALGGMVGQPAAGGAAGAWLSKVTGFGDYEVSANTLMRNTSSGVPGFMKNDRKVVISHREYIGELSTPGAVFTVASYNINPGNPTIFPWLSSIAANYQQYRFKGIIFEFLSASADALNSTNTALGTVIMATNYNISRPNFASKLEMEQSEFACRCKPSESVIHPIECNPEETPLKHLYIRSGPVDGTQDLKFYDLANFQIATVGQQASSVIGELWVSYEVELLKPRLPGQIAGASAVDWAWRTNATFSNTDIFGTGGLVLTGYGNIPVAWQNNILSFPPTISSGTFMVSIFWSGGTPASGTLPTPTISSNASANTSYPYNGYNAGPNAVSSPVFYCTLFVRINAYSAAGTTITWSGATLPTSATLMGCMVVPAPTIPAAAPY